MQYLLVLIVAFMGAIYAQRTHDNRDHLRDQSAQSQHVAQDEQSQRQYYQGQQRKQSEPVTIIPIIKFDKQQSVDGSYQSEYETGNNIHAEEVGFLKDLGKNEEGDLIKSQVQQGSFSYVAPDGQIITVNYIADENGFQVQGDHLPTPPPPSEEISKGLKLIYDGIRQRKEDEEREARLNPKTANQQQQQQQQRQQQQRP